jgi:hypothetical protein
MIPQYFPNIESQALNMFCDSFGEPLILNFKIAYSKLNTISL